MSSDDASQNTTGPETISKMKEALGVHKTGCTTSHMSPPQRLCPVTKQAGHR